MTLQNNHLTEQNLGDILKILYPDEQYCHDMTVPGSLLKRARPDYRYENLKLIVEFDGFRHYSSAKQVCLDEYKDYDYLKLGYRVVRIPYFIQLDQNVIKTLFPNASGHFESTYPHGFISPKALLPADFCSLGVKRFTRDLVTFPFAAQHVLQSLADRIGAGLDYQWVIPESCDLLLNDSGWQWIVSQST